MTVTGRISIGFSPQNAFCSFSGKKCAICAASSDSEAKFSGPGTTGMVFWCSNPGASPW
ncbi:Uncharacterised protein [Vibrio cholerae]|nr:Uncharacterised protein [Vibrio cholerae]